MFSWRIIRQFPKYAIVLGVVVIATALFAFWWYFRFSFFRRDYAEAVKAKRLESRKLLQLCLPRLATCLWLMVTSMRLRVASCC
jgi:hypothetical protein